MSETIIDRDMHAIRASYGNGGANAPSSALYSTAAAFSNPTTLTPLSVPTHMQHVPSYSNLLSVSGTFSDTDTESDDFKTSPSSGIEADVDRLSPLYDDFDALIGAQEAACTRGCSTHLQGYIEDLELITHAASKDLRAVTGLKLSSTTPEPQETTLQRWKRLSWPLVVFLIIGVVMVLMGRGHLLELLKWMERMPWLESIFVFAVLFTLVSFPFGFGYIILNMMAGYLYGFFRGQIIVMLSVSIGFSVAFILCRSWLKDYARGIVNSNALQAVLRVVEGPHGFKVILLTRFTPIPFGLQNVLFAVSSNHNHNRCTASYILLECLIMILILLSFCCMHV